MEVFGSVVTDAFDSETSDIDFLVTYPPDYEFGPWMSRLQDLEERLSEIFDRNVDLVIAKEFRNPYFARSVNETRRVIYEA